MYGLITGITDTDDINYCPKCGEKLHISEIIDTACDDKPLGYCSQCKYAFNKSDVREAISTYISSLRSKCVKNRCKIGIAFKTEWLRNYFFEISKIEQYLDIDYELYPSCITVLFDRGAGISFAIRSTLCPCMMAAPTEVESYRKAKEKRLSERKKEMEEGENIPEHIKREIELYLKYQQEVTLKKQLKQQMRQNQKNKVKMLVARLFSKVRS